MSAGCEVSGPVQPWLAKLTPLGTTLAMLTFALRGREPVFHSVPELEPGRLMWLDDSLPNVYAAPDLFARLRRAFERAPGVGYETSTMPRGRAGGLA
jgi:hypothetical protein